MPWSVERIGSTLNVQISIPMNGEWERLMDEIQSSLDPRPLAIHVPSKVEGAAPVDADMLKMLWSALRSLDIPLLPPTAP